MTRLPAVNTLGGVDLSDLPPSPAADRHVHIVLLGLMGSGKSTAGLLVANELGRPFVDSDSIVELLTGRLPPELVEQSGVKALHEAELRALHQVVRQQDSVVYAAAASVVDRIDTCDVAESWCVWLETSPALIAERIGRQDHGRPLLGDHPREVLEAQHAARAEHGRQLAAVTIETDARTPNEVAACICNAWRQWAHA